MKNPPPDVFLVALGESTLNLQLNARTSDYRKKFRIETSLREEIYKIFQREGIEAPIPQRIIRLTGSSNAKP